MKLLLCVNSDLPSLYSVNLLRTQLLSHTVDIVLSPEANSLKKVNKDERFTRFKERLSLAYVLAHQPADSTLLNYVQLQKQGVIRSFKTGDINTLQMPAYDIIVSIRYGIIIQQAIINETPLGIINLHSGLLPQYRGVMPTFWSMLEKRKNIGYTMHWIDSEKLDAGRVILKKKITCDYTKTAVENMLRIYTSACHDLTQLINQVSRGETLHSTEQDISQGRYFSVPKKHHLTKATHQGLVLINNKKYDEYILPAIFNIERDL